MNNKILLKKLKSLDACSEAVKWTDGYDLKTAWKKCKRADWMLWFIYKMEIGTKKERIHITCDCASLSLKYVPKGENRPREAIEAARRYADNPTEENRKAAGAATWAAGAAGAAAEAAAGAAAEATWAAEAAVGATWAAEAAVGAAEAAGAAGAAAEAAAHKKMCCIIRKKIKL